MSSTSVRDDQLPSGAGSAGEVTPVPAATVLLLRDSPLEVLMLRRHERSSFVPNVWVFPGGVVEPGDAPLGDGSELSTMRIAAARELFEESGVWLGRPLDRAEQRRQDLLSGAIPFADLIREAPIDFTNLTWTSRWITPIGVPKRFDTYFFLAAMPTHAVATAEQVEAVEVLWIAPALAIAQHARGELPMVFPTLKNLEAIASFNSLDALIAERRGAAITATRPVLVIEDGQKKIVLPPS